MRRFSECSSIVDLLESRAAESPNSLLYTFLNDGERAETSLTCSAVERSARAIASYLQSAAPAGERALLMFQPGLDFITAFLGCLYAGVIAVPAFPPRNARTLPRIQSILSDSQPKICLTHSQVLARSRELFEALPQFSDVCWIATDHILAESHAPWTRPALRREAIAYLQYTSGSTSVPKGVMISHGNLLHNLSFICDQWGHREGYRIVSWVPFFHDMGLIYGVLQPLYGGGEGILMPPAAFLQRPFRWLEALSRFKADSTVAPNFAYDLCAHKVSEEEKRLLDLSNWSRAHNAAEPVRIETLERFAAAFACCGFHRDALKPGYGLAEATLAVTFARKGKPFHAARLAKSALGKNRVIPSSNSDAFVHAVACGEPAPDQQIVIVHPESLAVCRDSEVGEIWLSGPSVALGYWGRDIETQQTFNALTSAGVGPFLRTGDLGFIKEGELYVTGRLKDMILIRGVNHYPHDIETTVQKAHPTLQPDAGAAFGIDMDGEERLVIVQELVRHHRADLNEVLASVRSAVAETHGVEVHAIVLIRANSIPKTTSGKIQRGVARMQFLERTLKVELEWKATVSPPSLTPEPESGEGQSGAPPRDSSGGGAGIFESWLRQRLSVLLGIRPEAFDRDQPFSRYGLDSLRAATLAGELQDSLHRSLPSSLLFDYPTIAKLSLFLDDPNSSPPPSPKRERSREPIAIIGMACRFPGANNPQEFWTLLRTGRDAISEVPSDRWDAGALYDPKPGTPGRMNTRWGGFLKDVAAFDAEFFEISPREAVQMDPQQRLLLEVTWEALEHAGVPPGTLAGSRTGVFVGVSSFDYALLQLQNPAALNAYVGTGMAHSVAANRISYFLDLRGPSLAVDTACSSSLVAIHQACESLLRGESALALAGGVNLILRPEFTIALSHAHMMASDGRCKTFDVRADGYVRGEGCGIVILKRLSDAIRDGNSILGLVAGSAVNQDGHSNGLTAPNGPAQEAVITQALQSAEIPAREISFVECHGTGTALGDPQEIEALQHVLGAADGKKCRISSVKTNIGHLEAAAGIAGVIKTVLCLVHKEIPPHLHLQALNPRVRLDQTRFDIPRQLTPWDSESRRAAGVSSFGFGGTNAHVILAEATIPERTQPEPRRPRHILTLSAKTSKSLRSLASAFRNDAQFETSFADACATTTSGRSHFRHRLAIPADSAERARDQLARFLSGEGSDGFHAGTAESSLRPKLVFLFTGQGSQYAGMAQQLYETQPVFRSSLQRCDEILREIFDSPLVELLYGSSAGERLAATRYGQPVLFSVEFALAEMWRSWGVIPDAVMGYSVGEYVAACLAGVFTLEEGLRLTAIRAALIDSLPAEGQMAMVFADAAAVQHVIGNLDQVSIAAINAEGITVISGRREAVQRGLSNFEAEGIGFQIIPVAHAFHSPMIEPILKEFEVTSRKLSYLPPKVPMISNLTGDWFGRGSIPDATYWTHHIRQPVQFARGVSTLLESGFTHFLECGPAPTLVGMAKRNAIPGAAAPQRHWLPSLKQNVEDWQVVLDSLAQLYVSGWQIDWTAFEQPYGRQIVPLPSYPFQRSEYWLPSGSPPEASQANDSGRSWNRLVQIGRETSESSDWKAEFKREKERMASLNELSSVCLLRALEHLGVFAQELRHCSPAELCGRLGIHGRFAKAMEIWRRALIDSSADAGAPWAGLSRASAAQGIQAAWREAVERFGDAHVPDFVRRCGEQLAEVITGKLDPLTLLFPHGDFSVVEKLYRDSGPARQYNTILARLAAALSSERSERTPLRILEVGGGTGGSTSHVLPALANANIFYTFTDLSPAFVQHAQARFGAFPFVTCRVLDLERDPEAQGLTAGSFDLVIAANVFHATRRIATTLRHVRSLLAPAGHLLLWEATAPQLWLDITFGLLEGWHRYEDIDLRPHHPLLSPDRWLNALHAAGFQRAHPFPDSEELSIGQHIILAQAKADPQHSPLAAVVTPAERNFDPRPELARLFYQTEWILQPPPKADPRGLASPTGSPRREQTIPRETIEQLGVPSSGLEAANASDSTGPGPGELWILLADTSGVAKAMAEAIQKNAGQAIMVFAGKEFAERPDGTFKIAPGNVDHLKKLFHALRARSTRSLKRVVHLWSADTSPAKPLTSAQLIRDQRLGIEAIIAVIQTLSANPPVQLHRDLLWIVTRGAQTVTASEDSPLNISQTPLWGLAKVIPLEHPNLWGGMIDLDPMSRPEEPHDVLRICGSADGERSLALRGGDCFVPRLKQAKLSAGKDSFGFSPRHSYLITGGLGGMGLKVARWMIERGARRLVLLGRTKLPERRQWKRLITGKEALSAVLNAILELEALGATVHLASVDVANQRQLAGFLHRFESEGWPPIRGVIHAAGVLDDRTIARLDRTALDNVLRPKVAGAWNLHALLQNTSLDFFVMFSSVAAVLGSVGQGNHAAANAFLDGLAHWRRRRSLPAQSIDWGPWADVGAAVRSSDASRLSAQGISYLSADMGIQSLEVIMSADPSQPLVLDVDWSVFLQSDARNIPFLRELAPDVPTKTASEAATPHARAEISLSRAQVMERIREAVATLLMVPPERVGQHEPLNRFGFDSLMAVQLQNEIELHFGASLALDEITQSSVLDLVEKILSPKSLVAPSS